MFSVTVRDHIMIAHSLQGAVFGPAQQLHGATFLVDVTFKRPELDENGIVVDIGLASEALQGICKGLSYRNLDDDESLAGVNTTTERLAQIIADRIVAKLQDDHGLDGLTGIAVTLHESHVAWANFERAL